MKRELKRDLATLKRLPFKKRHEPVGRLLTRIHATLDQHEGHPDGPALEIVRAWLLVPFTLWPVDFAGLAAYVVGAVGMGRRVRQSILFLLDQVGELPSVAAQQAVAEHERLIETGGYELLARSKLKFTEREAKLLRDPGFQMEWGRLKRIFPVERYRNHKALIRRTMVQERNFRPDWEFRPTDKARCFQAAFDAFCHRWNLYGMEDERPLVLKLSVNLTAHGTMIVIPAFWSFDPKRDLDWRLIMRLHRVRGVARQGPKMSVARMERGELSKKARSVWKESGTRGLRGEEREQWVKHQLGLDERTDSRTVRRLRKAT